ncbi:oxidative stress-induced growth inhibitor 1 isoform X1 [Nomia melanderi]|uniref:oxidative stress-induced growth inhibitor 1 isoform X1 n=2 Tax=Nomia melanderi TaxID=2448451 RepID=UPI003FCCED58
MLVDETRRTMQNCYDDEENGVVHKDAVIIGNGPSGICVSYMLAGNWPYYTGEPHPGDEMLTARLHWTTTHGEEEAERNNVTGNRRNNGQNRLEEYDRKSQDGCLARSTRRKLKCLSSGLEGRVGGRPLALLMDQLQHPCVDSGLDVPSLLAWKSAEQNSEHKPIDHVVLGKSPPGGTWQSMDPNVLTISLNRWMSLPDLDIRQWETMLESEQLWKSRKTDGEPYAHEFDENPTVCKTASRISAGTVAAYYDDYVQRKGLKEYFRCGTTVTSVREDARYGWTVEGFETETGKPFRYRCKTVILATGSTDSPNRLGVPGEDAHPEWVTHYLNDLESKLDRLLDRLLDRRTNIDSGFPWSRADPSSFQLKNGHHDSVSHEHSAKRIEPVLVIGGGLSAADAIMAARFRGIPVLHAFRDTTTDWAKSEDEKPQRVKYEKLLGLPSSMYPEYHKVYEMMADGGSNYPLYRALPGYTLRELCVNGNDRIADTASELRTATLSSPEGRVCTFRVSIVAILIGYKPDLSYLEAGGVGLGKVANKPIDCKSNPIEVDDFTYEVIKAPRSGLYALGPLVGDNFVRYILGGAFGILVHTLRRSTT